MPSIRSVDIQPDSVTIVYHKGTKTFLRSDIPENVINKPIATIEAFGNTWLNNNIEGCQGLIHIFTVTPLVFTTIFADEGSAIPPNWWLP